MLYPPDMTLGEAREAYFERSGFGLDGGYAERWIKVKVWRMPIWLPNTAGRVRAVKLHDLHHIVTEYPTTWRGEAEISAWEVGSGGLRRFWAGWWLDLMNVAQGLIINPGGTYRAFMRGRRSRNLFALEFDDAMLSERVGDYRGRLLADTEPSPAGAMDKTAFAFWAVAGSIIYLVSILLPFLPVIALGWLIWG
jgi:hypothetical protein